MEGFKHELINNILTYWTHKMVDNTEGGFFGRIDGHEKLFADANKGSVLNMRILWTFSAAYRIFKDQEYKIVAQRAFNYIKKYFIDDVYGGIYWELDYKGNPVNTKKQIYAQGFALYAFSEYYRAVGDESALDLAKKMFFLIEEHKDIANGGYYEAFARDWSPILDVRLSEKDANELKSMNTHLHILEPYTNLLRIWKDGRLQKAQRELLYIFTDKILDKKTCHQHLFFGENWDVKSSAISYGHDIEAAWLLYEAAEVLDDKQILDEMQTLVLKIADAAANGLKQDGCMIYEKDGAHTDTERHWWVQAEGVVGYMYAYKISQQDKYKNYAQHLWHYIQKNMVDAENGEWYWGRLPDGSINRKDDKAGFWKCPYHNSRMCMEMIENFGLK